MDSQKKRQANGSNGVVGFMLVFFPLCWLVVIGDQLGWGMLNPPRYMLLQAAIVVGYTGTVMSAGVIAVAILAAFRTRNPREF
jgi:hypothetical protein